MVMRFSVTWRLLFTGLLAGLILIVGGVTLVPAAQQVDQGTVADQVPDALIEPGSGPDRYIIVVEKASQLLFLFQYKLGEYYLIREMECTTGENLGDKQIEGDQRTPEGYYIFNKKSLESDLAPIYGVLAFPMDYPNFWDERLGKNGYGIWLHGTNRKRIPRDSNGCVALENIDIIYLESFIKLFDTPIVIYDRIQYATPAEIAQEAARIKNFFESWRQAWEKKDFDEYMSKYARDFRSNDGKDYEAWKKHKERLNEIYPHIRVDVADLRIFRHQGMILLDFEQYYRGGDNFQSDGVKRLFIREKKRRKLRNRGRGLAAVSIDTPRQDVIRRGQGACLRGSENGGALSARQKEAEPRPDHEK